MITDCSSCHIASVDTPVRVLIRLLPRHPSSLWITELQTRLLGPSKHQCAEKCSLADEPRHRAGLGVGW